MMDEAVSRTAAWLDGSTPLDGKPAELWACVEIFGHRRHYGRVSEVERFGAKLLRVDVPIVPEAPLLGDNEVFETHVYGGAAIFSLTPMTETAARSWAKGERPEAPMRRLAYDPEFEEPE
jgi:hypothetical protein